MTDVLLGQSYYLRFDPKLWVAMQPYPPLGTLYAASYLRDLGYDVAVFDAMLAQSEAEWQVALRHHEPRFAVLYEDNFNYLSKMCLLRMRQAAFSMIDMAREAGCAVIVAGADASDHAAQYLARGAQFVVVGEGEHTLGELLDRLSSRTDTALESIQGLVFAGPDGELVRTPARPNIRNLDALPFPARDLVDVDRYRTLWHERHGTFSMNLVTSRGCPYHCNWCAKPIWGQRHAVRSPENVVAELSELKRLYGPDHLWFADDILGIQPGWIERFADLVEQAGLRTPFKSLNRADLLLKGDSAKALARAGAVQVWIGAESGSQSVLDAMEKGTRVEQIYAAAERLHESGVQVGFFLQFGYPGETWDDIQRTLQMVRDCRPDDIGVSVSYPLPGTPFYERVRAQLGARENWVDSDDLAMLYRGPYSTEFYRALHRAVHAEFRRSKLGGRSGRRQRSVPVRGAGYAWHTAKLALARLQLARLRRRPSAGPASLGLGAA